MEKMHNNKDKRKWKTTRVHGVGLMYTYVSGHVSRDEAWCNAIHTNVMAGPLGSQAFL